MLIALCMYLYRKGCVIIIINKACLSGVNEENTKVIITLKLSDVML